MRHNNLTSWLPGLLVAALLLPVGLFAQERAPQGPPSNAPTEADRQNRREGCEQARQRLQEARQRLQEEREAYHRIVQEYGKDSPQAREARERLRQHMERFKELRQEYAQHCGGDRRRPATNKPGGSGEQEERERRPGSRTPGR